MTAPTAEQKPTPLTQIAALARALGVDLDPGEKSTPSAWSIRLFAAKRDARRAVETDPSEVNDARFSQLSELESLVSLILDARRAEAKAASDDTRPRERALAVERAAAARRAVSERLSAM